MDYVAYLKHYSMQLSQSGADEAAHYIFEAALELQKHKAHIEYFKQKAEYLQYLLDKKEVIEDVRAERE